MKGVIRAPHGIITGAFTVLFTFLRDIQLTAADIVIRTVEGDALGHTKDTLGGGGAHWHLICYMPDARSGTSEISVVKEGVAVDPITVVYDTVKTIEAHFGTPTKRGNKIEIPVSFDVPIQHLKKRNFRLSYPTPHQLYGTADTYTLVIPDRTSIARFTVSVQGTVQKTNGVAAEIKKNILEVDRGTLN